jgi:hypothetical protein
MSNLSNNNTQQLPITSINLINQTGASRPPPLSKKPNSILQYSIVPQQTPVAGQSNKSRITVIPINLPQQYKIVGNNGNSTSNATKKIIINASCNQSGTTPATLSATATTTTIPQATIITKSLGQNLTSIGGGGANSATNNKVSSYWC